MIRLLAVLLMVLIFFLVFSIPLYFILWLIGKRSLHARSRAAQAIVALIFRCILFLSGVKVTVRGEQNIPRDRSVLYIGNHSSYFDIIVGYTIVPDITGFIAKKEIRRIPFLNWWMYFVNCLFLDRDNIRDGLKTITKGAEYLKNGISIFVFPEGTRSKDGVIAPFKEGTMKLSEKSGAPIVPVTFTHTAEIFEQHVPFIRPAHVIVEFGQPIYMEGLDRATKKQLGAMTRSVIQETYDRLMKDA